VAIFDTLVPALRARFPDRGMRVDGEGYVIFPAADRQFGDLVIYDEGDEVTIMVGKFTHLHLGRRKEEPECEVASAITARVIEYLEHLFADRMLVWAGVLGFGRGQRLRDHREDEYSTFFVRKFVWSGPLRRQRK